MNLITLNIKHFIFVFLLINGLTAHAQDTIPKFTLDTSQFNLLSTISLGRYQPSFNYIYHSPDKKDHQRYKSYKYLIKQQPTAKNHKLYFEVACSLWEFKKIDEAEKMFLTMVNSKEKFYTNTYYHSSDVQGDKTKSTYGYGSFTSNYKHNSALYLAKIYLEQKKFDKALQFLEGAVKKYKATYTCGTGFYRQQDEYDFLYASCYGELNRNKEVIDLLLPSCLYRNDEIIITAIKRTYSLKEIKENLQKAETSIECSFNTFPSYAYQTIYSGTKKGKTDTLKYFSGTATINLFDRQINMPVPNLENGERLTMKHFIKLFKESNFYIRLIGDNQL
jgi:tetratricopeptide (TPR) repeat protein